MSGISASDIMFRDFEVNVHDDVFIVINDVTLIVFRIRVCFGKRCTGSVRLLTFVVFVRLVLTLDY